MYSINKPRISEQSLRAPFCPFITPVGKMEQQDHMKCTWLGQNQHPRRHALLSGASVEGLKWYEGAVIPPLRCLEPFPIKSTEKNSLCFQVGGCGRRGKAVVESSSAKSTGSTVTGWSDWRRWHQEPWAPSLTASSSQAIPAWPCLSAALTEDFCTVNWIRNNSGWQTACQKKGRVSGECCGMSSRDQQLQNTGT